MASAAATSSNPTKVIRGIKRVKDLLQHLQAKPQLRLPAVKSLKLCYAFRNDHFGARHFAKEDLPRIRYANPDLDIRIDTPPKLANEKWRPEMELEFENGEKKTISMDSKWSSAILQELMTVAGGTEWKQHVESCKAQGLPIVPPPASGRSPKHFHPSVESKKLPTFAEFKAKNPKVASEPASTPA